MDEQLVNNLKSQSRWLRLLYVVIFYIAGYLAGLLILVIGLVQIVHGFIKGQPHERLLVLSSGLNHYFFQVLQFITSNSDTKPYPFSDWPGADTHSSSSTDAQL